MTRIPRMQWIDTLILARSDLFANNTVMLDVVDHFKKAEGNETAEATETPAAEGEKKEKKPAKKAEPKSEKKEAKPKKKKD